jgi:hypothetical protein
MDTKSPAQCECSCIDVAILSVHNVYVVLFQDEITVPGMIFSEIARSVTITAKEGSVDFIKELGISLFIPANTVSEDESVEFFILPAFSGPFAYPDGLEPVSPVYLIRTDKETKFKRDITVQIQHTADLLTDQDCEDLVFTRASSIPVQRGPLFDLLYVFTKVEKSNVKFDLQKGPFAELKTNHFSLFMVCRKLRKNNGEDDTGEGNL